MGLHSLRSGLVLVRGVPALPQRVVGLETKVRCDVGTLDGRVWQGWMVLWERHARIRLSDLFGDSGGCA